MARLLGEVGLAGWLWAPTTAAMLVPLAWTVVSDLRRGEMGVDVIALLAMASSLNALRALGEPDTGGLAAKTPDFCRKLPGF